MQTKERIGQQTWLIRIATPLFTIAFLVPGLDYRLGWSRTWLGPVPLWLELLSQALVLCGLLIAIWVCKVNSFASPTIQVEKAKKSFPGPYRLVRDPMYLGR